MSGEPKTHTPGIEAKLTVAQVNALVNAIEQCWSHAAYPYNGPNPSREGEAAMKALRAAFYGVDLGVPVVARDEASGEGDDLTAAYMVGLEKGRDEAADLRAVIREWVRATDEFRRHVRETEALPENEGMGHAPIQVALDLDAAEAELRRLAGGESER